MARDTRKRKQTSSRRNVKIIGSILFVFAGLITVIAVLGRDGSPLLPDVYAQRESLRADSGTNLLAYLRTLDAEPAPLN